MRRARCDFLDRHLLRLAERAAERGSALEIPTARQAVEVCCTTVRHHRELLNAAPACRRA